MKIPYVIDNETSRMADVLNAVLAEHAGKSLDVAAAYFNLQGFWAARGASPGVRASAIPPSAAWTAGPLPGREAG
jgi:hypothetical protein